MNDPVGAYRQIAQAAIVGSSARSRLQSHSAVVLERQARAAGRTRWYFLTDDSDLESLIERVRPGSYLTFYFDERIAERPLDDQTESWILELISHGGDAVVGWLTPDTIELTADFPTSRADLDDFVAQRPPEARLFVGPFPSHLPDAGAVFIHLPDRDGEIREQPH